LGSKSLEASIEVEWKRMATQSIKGVHQCPTALIDEPPSRVGVDR